MCRKCYKDKRIMETTEIYNQTEELFKQNGFKVEFQWASTKGYSDTDGMHPAMRTKKDKIGFNIFFDHSVTKEIHLIGGDIRETKPTYKMSFPIRCHEEFLKYLSEILEGKH